MVLHQKQVVQSISQSIKKHLHKVTTGSHIYLRQGGNVFARLFVCLSICLSVCV